MDFCPRLYRFSQHALARFPSLRYGRHGNNPTVFQLNLEGEARHLHILQNGGHAHLVIGRAFNRGNARLGTIECRSHHILRNSCLDAHMGKSRGNGGSGSDPFGSGCERLLCDGVATRRIPGERRNTPPFAWDCRNLPDEPGIRPGCESFARSPEDNVYPSTSYRVQIDHSE